MIKNNGLTRVLLDPIVEMRRLRSGRGAYADSSIMPIVIEELIGSGVDQVVISDKSRDEFAIDTMPIGARKRISFADKVGECEAKMQYILDPILKEAGVERKGRGAYRYPSDTVNPLAKHVIGIDTFETILLGIENQCFIRMDIDRLKSNLELLNQMCNSRTARHHVAILRGVLSSYEKVELPGISMIPNRTSHQLDYLDELVRDHSFKSFSRDQATIGFIDRARHMIPVLQRSAEKILSSPKFGALFDYSTRVFNALIGIPLPDSNDVRQIVSGRYLPPITDLDKQIRAAREVWVRTNPKFIPAFAELSAHPDPDDFMEAQPFDFGGGRSLS